MAHDDGAYRTVLSYDDAFVALLEGLTSSSVSNDGFDPCVIWSCHPYCRKGTPVANRFGRRSCLSTRQFVVAVHKKELQKQLGRRNDKNAQERVRKTEKMRQKGIVTVYYRFTNRVQFYRLDLFRTASKEQA